MGITALCVCHKCKEYVDLDKSLVYFWLTGEAIRVDDEALEGWDEWRYIYEMCYAWRALRFAFLHNSCVLDIVFSHDEDWDIYMEVVKNYKEICFSEDIKDMKDSYIWERRPPTT